MKFVALLSGGKDSIYATLLALRHGHELVCCAHLAPRRRRLSSSQDDDHHDDEDLEEESYMYQTAGSEAVRLQVEECMGLPFYVREIRGKSRNTSLVYEERGHDEVEDLFHLLQTVQKSHPEIEAVSSGAILSTYQRTRIEHVCQRLRLTSLSYLWRMSSQRALLDGILDDGGIEAVLVRVACPPGLLPQKHLNRNLRSLRDDGTLDDLHGRWGMHPAGEGGEYETLVVDCPALFRFGRLKLEEVVVVCDESDEGVGILRIRNCRVEKKMKKHESGNEKGNESEKGNGNKSITSHHYSTTALKGVVDHVAQSAKSQLPTSNSTMQSTIPKSIQNRVIRSMHLPNVRIMKGGLCHISALISPIACDNNYSNNNSNDKVDEAEAAVREFLTITQMLQTLLSRLTSSSTSSITPQDIIYVHLYLSEISHFAKINRHYQQYFGTHLPPSRSCVAVGHRALPGGRRVMMDCILQCDSGRYLRTDAIDENSTTDSFLQRAMANHHHPLRKVLHVQSLSTWAPVCIGPYSQANVLRSSLVFLAGMIGLIPETMRLIQSDGDDYAEGANDWELELHQSWRNAASVLDGLDDGGGVAGGKLEDCLGGLVYLSLGALEELSLSSVKGRGNGGGANDNDIPWEELWSRANSISRHAVSCNGGVVMGKVDGLSSSESNSNSNDGIDPTLYDEDGMLYGGYEDEETWREISGSLPATATVTATANDASESETPLLAVCLAELPMKAKAEVELICASRRAASCLRVVTSTPCVQSIAATNPANMPVNANMLWDTGYDFVPSQNNTSESNTMPSSIQITSVARSVGHGCASVSTVMATWIPHGDGKLDDSFESDDLFDLDIAGLLNQMIDSSITSAGAFQDSDGNSSSLFTIDNILNVRLYYKAAIVSPGTSGSIEAEVVNDGSMLRTELQSVLKQKKCVQGYKVDATGGKSNGISSISNNDDIPAYTVVPILGMSFIHPISGSSNSDEHGKHGIPLIAMQVTFVDMVRMETEMWIRYGHNK